jgi:hypothetical protein
MFQELVDQIKSRSCKIIRFIEALLCSTQKHNLILPEMVVIENILITHLLEKRVAYSVSD